MAHASLKLIPGVDQTRTEALNEAALWDSNLIRFMPDRQGQGLPQKLGGWTKFLNTVSWNTTVRALHSWADTNNKNYFAVGSENSLWSYNSVSGNAGITPQYYTANIPVSVATTLNSATVLINDTNSNVTSFDSVYIATPIAIDALVLSGFYPCTAVGANSYDVIARNILGTPTPASSTTSGGAVPTFTVDSSTPVVTVTLANHGYSVGSTFAALASTTVGGVNIYGNYIVTSLVVGSTSKFTITADHSPTSATLPVLSASWAGGSATITTNNNTTIPVGTSVTITGMTPSGYNGTYPVSASSSGSFSYLLSNPGTATVLGTVTAPKYTVPMNGGLAQIIYFLGQTATPPPTGYGAGGYGAGGYGTGVSYSGSGRIYTSVGIVGNSTTNIAVATLGTNVYVTSGSTVSITSTHFTGTYTVLTATPTGTFTFSNTSGATDSGATVAVTQWGFEMPFLADKDWSLDNWGGYLIASPHNGEIFYWDEVSDKAVVVPNAPLVNEGCFVAMPERQIVAYGSTFTGFQDPLLVRWCDIGNFTSWVGTVTNQAGSYRIPKGSKIVGGIQGPQQGLIWTDLGLWAMQYINLPLVYSFNEIASGCGLVGRKAMGILAGTVYWMSQSQFFRLSGNGVEPVQCPIWDVIFQDIDKKYLQNVRCAPNSRFGEITWYYPILNADGTTGDGIPKKYAKYNALMNQWDFGTLTRTAWIDQSVFGPPIGADSNLNIYQHETSNDADGAAITSWFQTGYFAIQDGDLKTFVDQVWPDMKWGLYGSDNQNATVKITFFTADYPGDTPKAYSYTVTQGTQFVTPRLRARLVAIRIESSDFGSFWRVGNIRYRYQPDGKF